jgi:GDP-L-fucose synthase
MSTIRGRRVVVTGGAGFLGRHVVDEVQKHQPESVFVPRSAEYDLRDRTAIRKLFAVARPQVIIHLAAVVGGIGANRNNPGKFFYDNAIMGIQLLEEARAAGIEKYVQVGTICAYPCHTPVPFKEDNLWDGYPEVTNAPYGVAKKALIVMANGYREQYGVNAISVLPVNLYGPWDSFDLENCHVIPALIRKFLEAKSAGKKTVEAWGTGKVSREFIFVRDAACGIVMATDQYNKPDPVNIGSGHEITIRDLTYLIGELCGFDGEIVWDPTKPDGQPRRCLDVSRAKAEFGFEAEMALRDGLIETIDWYRKNPVA